MKAFLSGQDVTLTIPLQDDFDNALVPTALSYRVVDQDEVELIAKTALALPTAGDSAEVTIPGDKNVVVPGDPPRVPGYSATPQYRQVRVVELYVVTAEGTVKLVREYVIEAEEVLVEAINSFQNYGHAIMVGMNLPQLPHWNDASKQERITALIRARQNIGMLRFRYVFDAYQNIVDNTLGVADLTLATPAQWAAFPRQFKEALQRAQVIEADYLLMPDDTIAAFRRDGLMSMTVGEAKQFFRPQKPIEGPVCKRAMRELTKWVLSRHRVTRT